MKKEVRKSNYRYMIYAFFAIFVIAFLVCMNHMNQSDSNSVSLQPIHLIGTYSADDGVSWQNFSKYEDIQNNGKTLLVRAHVQKDVSPGSKVMLYLYRLDVKIAINGKSIYRNDENELTHWDNFLSDGITTKDQVLISMSQLTKQKYDGSYKMFFDNFYSGSVNSLLHKKLYDNRITILFCVIGFTVGIASIFFMSGLLFLGVPGSKGFFTCGLLLVVGSICTFINYDYVTLLFHHDFLINLIDFVSQIIIVLLLIIYLKNYLITKKYILIATIFVYMWMLTIASYFILRLAGLANETNMTTGMAAEGLVFFLVLFIFLLKDYRKYNEKRIKYVSFSGVILLIATTMEIIHYVITNIFWINLFQFALIVFMIVQYFVMMSYSRERVKDANKKKELEAQLAQNRISIMLSQIQPHFLYNTLTVIYNLCEKDPEQAQYATAEFSDYLRGNLDSLNKKVPVPFESELGHVKLYLELEQMRFGDELKVVYDIQTMDFMIPALTIQPIIENAVKHGVGKKEDGGTVTISTKELEKDYVIQIMDDGVGFDVNKQSDDNRSHIGIENVKSRLCSMSKASLEISSVIGQGTVAVIRIPKEEDIQ